MAGPARSTDLDLLRERASAPANRAMALPFFAYTEESVFELERERVFEREWVAVCAERELATAGDYMAATVAGEPLVVVRDRSGALRALSNVCRHRGTILVEEGRGNTGRLFVCPYHGWTYDTSGALVDLPFPGEVPIDRSDHRLPRFSVEVWAGIVFVSLDVEASALAPRLSGLERHLAPYGVDRYRHVELASSTETWKANWKLVFQNGVECYHLYKVHPQSIEPLSPTKGAFYIEGAPHWSVTGGHNTTRIEVGDRPDYTIVSIPPSFVGFLSRESWVWVIAHPHTVGETRVTFGSLTPLAPDGARPALGAYADFVQTFVREDRTICERGQRGMRSRKSDGGQLVGLERTVGDFHQYLAARLFDPDEGLRLGERG